MKTRSKLAAIFIILTAATTAAMGQKIYRCGSEYSQVPCADAVVVQADDPRSSAQKVQSDVMIQRNAAAARSMEKARLEEEAALNSATASVNASSKQKKHTVKPRSGNMNTAQQPAIIGVSSESKKMKKKQQKQRTCLLHGAFDPNTQDRQKDQKRLIHDARRFRI